MKCKVLSMTATLVASGLLIGCNATTKTTSHVELTPVSVRFVMPPEPDALAHRHAQSDARLTTDGSYDGFADLYATGTSPTDVYHVALWGDAFAGNDVTYGLTSLQPGEYTFAFVDRKQGDMMQGWLDVNQDRDSMLGFLRSWKNQIPEYKRQFAYDFEIRNTPTTDPEGIKAFKKQIAALDRLEKQLDKMIRSETRSRDDRRRQTQRLFTNTEFRIMPGGQPVFHPATRAAFNDTDMTTVRKGDPVTKFVMLADHTEVQWKMDRVTQLYNELKHCKAVMQEAANRFERQKGLFLLTDHLHPDDGRFVENEIRLQNTLAVVERLDEQLSDVRHRRLALAFVSGLLAPRDHFRAINEEEQDLMRERVVLDTEARRLDLLIEKADASQDKRVALERNRQRVMDALHNLDQHIEDLWSAHRSLEPMITSKAVIHRQGDQRLVATTLVSDKLPVDMRQAVENEAVMTVRLEKSDSVFIPPTTDTRGSVTYMPPPDRHQTQTVARRHMTSRTTAPKTHMGSPAVTSKTSSRHTTFVPHKTRPVSSRKTYVQKPQFGQPHQRVADVQNAKTYKKKPARHGTQKFARKTQKPQKGKFTGSKASKTAFRTRTGQPKPVLHDLRPTPGGKLTKGRVVYDVRRQTRPVVSGKSVKSPNVKQRVDRPIARPTRTVRTAQNTQPNRSVLDVYKKTPARRQKLADNRHDRLAQMQREWHSPQAQPQRRQAQPHRTQPRRARFVGQPSQDTYQPTPTGKVKNRNQGCELPWFLQVFVPPCWFVGTPPDYDVNLVNYKDPAWQKTENRGCNLPWIFQIFVPPCWFANSGGNDARLTQCEDPGYDQPHHQRKPHHARTTSSDQRQTHQPSHRQRHVDNASSDRRHARKASYKQRSTHDTASHKPRHARKASFNETKKDRKGCELPWFLQVFVPPCWFVGTPPDYDVNLVNYQDPTWQEHNNKGCNLPWILQVFVPPCWFIGQQQSNASLADYKDPAWQDYQHDRSFDQTNRNDNKHRNKKDSKGCDLPWFIQVLVPP
ncbi:MAG: hypothetical protein PVI86_04690, partial [Phycisphaerae bacterium]